MPEETKNLNEPTIEERGMKSAKGCADGCAKPLIVIFIIVVVVFIVKSFKDEFIKNDDNLEYNVGDEYSHDEEPKDSLQQIGDELAIKEEEKRKEIFGYDGKLYKEAVEKAMVKYPDDLDKQVAYEEQLQIKVDEQVMKKYGLIKEELDAIRMEGSQRRWEWDK